VTDLLAQGVTRPSQVGFKNLAHIHTARYAEGVKYDLDGRSVFEVGHVLFRQNTSDDALVSVTAGHLVANAQLALHRDVDFDQLDHARRQLVALGEFLFLLIDDLLQHINLTRGHFFDLVDLLIHSRILVGVLDTLQVAGRDALNRISIKHIALVQEAFVGALVVQVGLHFLAAKNVLQALEALVGKNADFVGKIFLQLADLRAFDELGTLVLFLSLAGENLHVDNDALDARRAVEGSVAYVAGFFAEDGTQQLLFGRELGFTLGRNLTYQDVALLDAGADADHACFVQIAQHRLADVGNVARDFFRTKLRIASFDLILLDVQRSVVVVLHHLLGDENRVFEVVAAPGHEGHQHVASERQLAVVRARTVSDDLALQYALPLLHDGLLVDASVLVRTLELGELVDGAAHFTRKRRVMVFAFDAHDDAVGVHRIDDPVAPGQN